MPAVIESTLYTSPGGAVVAGSTQQNSREDLHLGYQIVMRSVHAATSYSWSLSFASDSPGSVTPGFDGTGSISALLAPEGATSQDAKFNVDYEGTYLIRLTVDAGLTTEDTQFIRCRVLTLFGALKLVAAGERRDELGVIPVDATAEGWANDQNANFQRISLLLRRLSSSGRLLYVDANRGRDSSEDQNDYDNVISLPGPESARTSETGMRLRAMAHGDFSSINDAITYALAAAARGEPAPSILQPYYIFVRAGLYTEDLNLAPFVHIIGEPGLWGSLDPLFAGGAVGTLTFPVTIQPTLTAGTGTHTFNPLGPWNTHQVMLANLHLDNNQGTALPLLDILGGQVTLDRCLVHQRGNLAGQGEAISCQVSNIAHAPKLLLFDSAVITTATTSDRTALLFDATGGSLLVQDSLVDAASAQALVVNSSLYQTCSSEVLGQSQVSGNEAFKGYGDSMIFADCVVTTTNVANNAINVTAFAAGAGSKAGDVVLMMEKVTVESQVAFESAGAVGTTSVYNSGMTIRGATSGQRVTFPDAPGDLPDNFITSLWSDSLHYVLDYADPLGGTAAAATIPAANQLTATTVQGAIDTLILGLFPVVGSPFYSLTSAYNGLSSLSPPTPGAGLGRNIDATSGAVQIQGATYPTAMDLQAKSGGLQIEGMVDIGGFIGGGATDLVADVGHSEIALIPDYTGAGPYVGLGRARWPTGVTTTDRGFGSASVIAGITNNPAAPTSNAPYHLHLRTSNLRVSGTGKAGNIYMVAGGINDSTSAHLGGDVHVVAGWTMNPAGTPGDVYIAPGARRGQTGGGVIWFVGAGGADTPATLTGVNAYAGGQAGTIYIGTPEGVESFTFDGTESLAAATTLINATARNVIATNDGTWLSLTGGEGPYADIRVVGDSTGTLALDTALGTLTAFTAGVYGHTVSLDVPAADTLRVNGSLIVTGSFTVTGDVKFITVTTPWPVTEPASVYSAKLAGIDIDIVIDAAMPLGRTLSVKDQDGLAAPAQQIVITDAAGGTFDGAVSLIINTAYGMAKFFKNDAGNWSIL